MKTSRLRIMRLKAGLRLEDVAYRLNVSKQAVSLWEHGQRRPTDERVAQLAALYGYSEPAVRRAAPKARRAGRKESLL